MAFLKVGEIELELKRSWIYEASADCEPRLEELDGERCVELESRNGRYKLVTTMEAVAEHLK